MSSRSLLATATVGLGLGLWACQGDPLHVYRVVYPASALPGGPPTASLLPEACYQPRDLPAPVASSQLAAESFCAVGKRPGTGTVSSNAVVAEEWTLFGGSDGEEFLLRKGSQGMTVGSSGRREGSQYVFTTSQLTLASVCPGQASTFDGGFFPPMATAVVAECNGKCVNLTSDPAHCGACGIVCPEGFVCAFSRCQQSCGGIGFFTCGGVQVDTSVDRNHCGACNNPCPPGTVCAPQFGVSQLGRCVQPCEALCARDSLSEGCGAPSIVTREVSTVVEVALSGDALTGNLVQGVAYVCHDGGCAPDFGSRCPSCTVALPLNGRKTVAGSEAKSQ